MGEVQHYVLRMMETQFPRPFEARETVPRESIADLVATMRTCAESRGASFKWPAEAMSFMQPLTAAMCNLPPVAVLIIETWTQDP